jgi:heme exporter protein A
MFNHSTESDCRSFALEANGLTLVRGRKAVLRDLHLAVSSGEMVALHGANGTGKTTLLQCLAGALHPTQGEVLWFGESLARSPAARGQIGFLGHDCGLYLALTAWENLLFAGRMYGLDHVAERGDAMLIAVGLQQCKAHHAGSLSRGQRQRLAIARAVLHDPPILLLDEPFTSLDSDSRDFLREFLCQRRDNGCAILIASHEMETRLFDRSLVLQGGRLHARNELKEQLDCRHSRPWRS